MKYKHYHTISTRLRGYSMEDYGFDRTSKLLTRKIFDKVRKNLPENSHVKDIRNSYTESYSLFLVEGGLVMNNRDNVYGNDSMILAHKTASGLIKMLERLNLPN